MVAVHDVNPLRSEVATGEKTRVKVTEHREPFGIFVWDKYVRLMNLIFAGSRHPIGSSAGDVGIATSYNLGTH